MPIWEYKKGMARAATTADTFNAIAESRRREILGLLAQRERTVNDLVDSIGDLTQPQVSKHLRVLREVGLVHVREEGRARRYRLNASPLREVHQWVGAFERYWDRQLSGIKNLAETKAKSAKNTSAKNTSAKRLGTEGVSELHQEPGDNNHGRSSK